MKIDEIIIKLCSERGYDPSQVNDYPTLLEQLECIKELLKTYPNQQYYTVKAYTYTASTKKFSFKISDVNNYGRQINIGDILIVKLANNILEIAQISSLDVEAGNGIADDVGRLTGKDGTNGINGESALVFNNVYVTNVEPTIGAKVNNVDLNSFNRTPRIGENTIMWLKYNNISYLAYSTILGVSTSISLVSVQFTDVARITGKDGKSFSEYTSISVLTDKGLTYDKDVYGACFNSQVTLFDGANNAIQTGEIYLPIKGGNGITVGTASDNKFLEVKVDQHTYFHYTITGVSSSSTNGTLAQEIVDALKVADMAIVTFNNENYYKADNQHTTGKLVFSYVGYEESKLIIKTITITIATKGWVLIQLTPPMTYAVGTCDISTDDAKQNIIGLLIYNTPMHNNQNADEFMNLICNMAYLQCSGYITYNGVTEPVIGADSYDVASGAINIYTPTHNTNSGGIACFITQFAPDYIHY